MAIDSELRPAFAGYLVDGKISNKELVATIADLIVKGYIDAPHVGKLWEKSKLDILLRTGKGDSGLLPFEKFILDDIFRNSDKVQMKTIDDIIDQKKAVKKIAEDLKSQDIDYDALQEKFRTYYRIGKSEFEVVPYIESSGKREIVDSKEGLKKFNDMGKIAVLIFLLISGLGVLMAIPFTILSFLLLPGDMFYAFLLPMLAMGALTIVILILIYKGSKHFKGMSVISSKESGDSALAKKYKDLENFLKSMPLEDGRLFNEYLPYAIAFGLDDYWNEKFGL